ncbi:restriction endonuclease subunit S [Lactiplantibacillus plantarum]|uniref:restriction endonuclease subunit S n=1 Tax=Lactiplantibacillus plantarum TaxID=1590 RepID=UPI002001C0CF|nr:restriction endonuclease subunit S [Lactiplantibacillus plantarum]MCK3677735.1 restriction endonuclease subunit S [Lactiplantibacillus plantarum]
MKDQQASYPQLRFKGFTDPWEERKLGDLGSVAMNKRIFKEQTSDVGDIPFYKIGTFGGTPDAFISRDIFEEYKSKYQYPEVGDILISASGSIGRTVVYQGYDEYFQDSNIVWLKHDQQLDNSFLKQFYSIVKWQGLEGSTIKRLYNKNILETKITLPSPEEQAQLGSFFKQLDDTIALHQRKLAKLKELKQGYLQKMFPQNASKFPQLRFAGFADAWEQRKLSDIATLNARIGWQNLRASEFLESGDYMLITGTNFHDGTVDYSTVHYVEKNRYEQDTKIQVENGSILITKDGTLGKVALVQGLNMPATLNAGVFNVKIKDPGTIDVDYVYQYLAAPFLMKYANAKSTGGTIKHLNQNILIDFPVPLPRKREQVKLAELLNGLDNTINLQQRKLEKLQELKKGYLQKMFC